jgi:undecaprenyl-diphosphatase
VALQRALWIYAAVALVALLILSIVVSARAYFGFDLVISRWMQLAVPPPVGIALDAVSWIGFPPEVDLIFGAIGVTIFLLGYRWEAICVTLAGLAGAASWFIIAPVVHRPRPAPDLIHVEQLLGSGSYPSGHVVDFTAFFGTLFLLACMGSFAIWFRRIALFVSAVMIVCIGFARIYSGEHWPSDVLAGYLQGSIVAALALLLYRARARGAPAPGSHSVSQSP